MRSSSLSSVDSISACNCNFTICSVLRQIPEFVSSEKFWCTRRRTRLWKSKQSSAFAPICSADNSVSIRSIHISVPQERVSLPEKVYSPSNAHSSSVDHEGSTMKDGKGHGESLKSTEIMKKLKRYGVSGILSYGLLNTAYYLTAFLLVWFYFSPAPGKLGFRAAAERLLKMMAMVWAGSQVTKLIRAGGALALAPFVDRGLSWFTIKFNFESEGKAFLTIVGFCFGLAVILFLAVTLLSA